METISSNLQIFIILFGDCVSVGTSWNGLVKGTGSNDRAIERSRERERERERESEREEKSELFFSSMGSSREYPQTTTVQQFNKQTHVSKTAT